MYRTLFARFGIASLMISSVYGYSALSVDAADSCPVGSRPATQADLSTMATSRTTPPKVGDCWDPNNAHIGVDAGDAKQYLASLPHQCVLGCQAPSDTAHIAHLDATFAKCAAQFLKAYIAQNGPVNISSSYRDMASGENARAGGARESNHTRGLAIDVQPTPNSMDNYRKMWKLASDNPSFGVCFPFQDHPFRGFPKGDRPHMILAGIGGSEGGKCDAQGVTKPCNGLAVNPKAGVPSGNPDPGASDPGTGDQQPPSTESPTTEEKTDGQVLTQDYQCLLGLNPIYVVTIPAGTPIASLPQCLNNSQAQKPMQCQPLFMCAGNTIVFQDSSCTKQSGQYCQFGCSNGACKQSQQQPNSQGSPPAPSTPSTPGTSGTPNTPASNDAITPSALTQQIASQAGTGGALTPSTLASPGLVANLFKSTSASSSLELLNALANNPSSLTSASPSGTSVVLNSDAQKITELHPPQTPIDTGGVTYARPASSFFTTTNDTPPTPGIIPNTRQSNMSDTFTSRDLATNPTAQPPSNNFSGDTFTSRSLSILSNLKIQLIRLLDFIRTQGNPFSGTIQNQLGEK